MLSHAPRPRSKDMLTGTSDSPSSSQGGVRGKPRSSLSSMGHSTTTSGRRHICALPREARELNCASQPCVPCKSKRMTLSQLRVPHTAHTVLRSQRLSAASLLATGPQHHLSTANTPCISLNTVFSEHILLLCTNTSLFFPHR